MLRRALRSALSQSGAVAEIVVVDDGDGAGALAARDILGRSGSILTTGGSGQVPARNLAIAQARGRWVAFLDDDDWWSAEDHLARLAQALKAGARLAHASGHLVREGDGPLSGEEIGFSASIDADTIRRDNTLLISGIAYDRALHAELGPLDDSYAVYWDWDWYLRLAEAGVRFAASGGDGVRISTRLDNTSADRNQAERAAELARLCAKHGLVDVALKNHEVIALEQRAARSDGCGSS